MQVDNTGEYLSEAKEYPLVSILCTAFNHFDFIKSALNGFVMQKTTFPFEIIIHDDASSDGTDNIIREYEEKYPTIIKAIYQKENQYSQKINIYEKFLFPLVKGKYIAFCEGDDYWTDPLKLQKQVDFLESNPDCSICFHAHKQFYNGETTIYRYNKFKIGLNEFLKENVSPATASMVFKNAAIKKSEPWMMELYAGDFVIRYLSFLIGDMGYIDDVMSVYNKGTNGSWSSRKVTTTVAKNEYEDNLKMLEYMVINYKNNFDEGYVVKKKQIRAIYYYLSSLDMPLVSGLFQMLFNIKIVGIRVFCGFIFRRTFLNLYISICSFMSKLRQNV